jgi:hypothetical protein
MADFSRFFKQNIFTPMMRMFCVGAASRTIWTCVANSFKLVWIHRDQWNAVVASTFNFVALSTCQVLIGFYRTTWGISDD